MLINNINYLREKYPYIREQLKSIEKNKDSEFTIEETRSGDKTLLYKNDENKTYFHSKYNPIREADSLIENYKEIKNQNIIFYGTGLGYHIDLLMTQNPDNNYYIFEPIPELLKEFLSTRDLTKKQYKNLKKLSLGLQNIAQDTNELIQFNRKCVHIIELPTHKQLFESKYKLFNEMFLEIISSKRSSMLTNYGYQKRWVVNTMKNFKEVLSTPNILIEKSGQFKGKPAILVSAGPSLDEEIENLKHIKENGLAYIFSVGSAINTLIHNNIHPDAVTTYDPTEKNQLVFDKVNREGIKDIPMIFGTSVGYEVLENYIGDKYHMITSQDPTSSYYLKTEEEISIKKVQDAPSIAVVTIQLLSQLGFSPIILTGQNLGYLNGDNYSEGIEYNDKLTEEEIKDALKTKDVYGDEILTNKGFNTMRSQIELYIKHLGSTKIINTTKGGANIEGAEFIELEKIIENELKENIVEKNWLEGNKANYDKEYLEEKLKSMDREYDRALKITRKCIDIIRKINKEINDKRISKAENLYITLDKEIRKMEKNDFYVHFLIPMNRVQYKMLAQNVQNINEIRDPFDKGKEIVKSYGGLISILNDDLSLLKNIYKDMKEDIKDHIE